MNTNSSSITSSSLSLSLLSEGIGCSIIVGSLCAWFSQFAHLQAGPHSVASPATASAWQAPGFLAATSLGEKFNCSSHFRFYLIWIPVNGICVVRVYTPSTQLRWWQVLTNSLPDRVVPEQTDPWCPLPVPLQSSGGWNPLVLSQNSLTNYLSYDIHPFQMLFFLIVGLDRVK